MVADLYEWIVLPHRHNLYHYNYRVIGPPCTLLVRKVITRLLTLLLQAAASVNLKTGEVDGVLVKIVLSWMVGITMHSVYRHQSTMYELHTAFISFTVRQGMDAIWGKTTMYFCSLVWTANPASNQWKMLDTAFISYGVLNTILGKTSYTQSFAFYGRDGKFAFIHHPYLVCILFACHPYIFLHF